MKELAMRPVRTMDSREIAELTGKRHADVIRDIEVMLSHAGIEPTQFCVGYLDAKGERRKSYLLPAHELMLLLTGYSVPLRDKVLRRWEELEAAEAAKPAPRGPELLALAVIEAQRMLEAKDAEIAALAPRALIADRITEAEGEKTLAEVGKITGLGPRRIVDLLLARGILYRAGRSILPKQPHIEAGRFVVREKTFELDGQDHLYSQTLVTGKGEVWIASLFAAERESA